MTTVLAPVAGASRMRARARVRTERCGDRNRLDVLRSHGTWSLRPVIGHLPRPWSDLGVDPAAVQVCVTAAAAGPLGGDELVLDLEVGEGSSLVLTESSATLVLPGHDGAESRITVNVHVAAGGTLVWLPQQVISVSGSDHRNEVSVQLEGDARLVLREQLLLGRKGEESGRMRQRVRVGRDGRPVLAQDLELGTAVSRSVSVAGPHRAVGSLLVVDPLVDGLAAALLEGDGSMLPLAAGGAVLVTALGPDNLSLDRQFHEALHGILSHVTTTRGHQT